MCTGFVAITFSILLNHFSRVHANKPNFHVVCVFGGCRKTSKTFEGYRSHLRRNYNDILENATNITNFDQRRKRAHADVDNDPTNGGKDGDLEQNRPFNDDLNPPLEEDPNLQEHEYERRRESASYILRMKEINRLTQKTVNDIVVTTSTLVRNTIEQLRTTTYNCLRAVGLDFTTIPNLEQVFNEDSPLANPFENLMTQIEQTAAFKELFGLVVS